MEVGFEVLSTMTGPVSLSLSLPADQDVALSYCSSTMGTAVVQPCPSHDNGLSL